jgi:hypothetical protein
VALGAGVPVAAAAAAADEAADILLHAHAHALNRTRRGAGTVAWTVASSFDGPGKTQIKPARSLRSGEADGWGSCAHTTAHRLRTDRERYQVQQTSRVLQSAKHQRRPCSQQLTFIPTPGPYTYTYTCTWYTSKYMCIDLSLMHMRACPLGAFGVM